MIVLGYESKKSHILGLTENEARVYLAALELGESTVARIARKAELKRTTASSIVDALKERGLMYASKNRGRNAYSAVSPKKFKEDFEAKQQSFDALLPELLSIANAIEHKPQIRYYEGFEGIKEAHHLTLAQKDHELLFWVSEVSLTHEHEEYWFRVYQPKRIENKIFMRAIVPNAKAPRWSKDADEKVLRKMRVDGSEHYTPRAEIILFGKRSILITSLKEQISLVIESPFLYTTLKSIFESHWRSLE